MGSNDVRYKTTRTGDPDKPMIILTSFKESRNLLKRSGFCNANMFSVSRFQPKGFSYQNLHFLAAMDTDGNKLNLRGRKNPLVGYKNDLLLYYKSVWDEIVEWVETLDNDEIDMLCCWCPHANHSKDQMESHGSFVCHTGLVGRLINRLRPDITVYMDRDHSVNLIDDYKPFIWDQLRI